MIDGIHKTLANMSGMGYDKFVVIVSPSVWAKITSSGSVALEQTNVNNKRKLSLFGHPLHPDRWMKDKHGYDIIVEARDITHFPIKRFGLKKGEWEEVDVGPLF